MDSAAEARTPTLPRPTDELESPPLTLRQLTWRRFRRHKMALLGSVVLILLFVYAFGGMLVFPESYANFNKPSIKLQAPSAAHPFGTDQIGRDILARTVYGGQISLLIGLTAMLVETIVGVLIGALAGYFGGIVDSLLMRFTEAMFTIPQIFLLLLVAKFFTEPEHRLPDITVLGRTLSGSVIIIILIIGLTSWMYLARIVRSQFLSLKEHEFVLAARATGTSRWQIIFRHILPNCIAPITVSATLGVGNAILTEAYISFLGLGVQAPTATWGNMLQDALAFHIMENAPHMWIFPSLFILLTVLSINFVGDGLRDALDPRSRAV